MKQFKQLLQDVLENGEQSVDRTGVGTVRVFGRMLRFDLAKGFPATTSKKLAMTPVVAELLWFLSGSTNVDRLREIQHGKGSSKKTIWDENYQNQAVSMGYTGGNLGPVYGKQWRDFNGQIDQIENVIKALKTDIETGSRGRRHIVTAWDPATVHLAALPPCHYSFQFFLSANNKLSIIFNMRSTDLFLGLPFNIASYALLCMIVAQIIGAELGEVVYSGADCHIYNNHLDQVNELLSNEEFPLPTLELPKFSNLDECLRYSVEDFKLVNYQSHGMIKAPMAI